MTPMTRSRANEGAGRFSGDFFLRSDAHPQNKRKPSFFPGELSRARAHARSGSDRRTLSMKARLATLVERETAQHGGFHMTGTLGEAVLIMERDGKTKDGRQRWRLMLATPNRPP